MKARTLIPEKNLRELKTLHNEVDEIKSNVRKILFILQNEGEVKEGIARELKARSKTPEEEYITHEEARKALMK